MSKKRILAIIVRHIYQLKHDLTRLVEMVWYPVIDLVIWGFVTVYLSKSNGEVQPLFLFFLGGIILWVIVYRIQMDMSLNYLVDVWDRNLFNLFASPLTQVEYILALTIVALVKLLITFFILTILAILLYSFSPLNIFGIYLLPFILNLLLMGWWMAVVINGIILRFGPRVESVAWALVYVFNPLSGVFFPLSAMPPVLRIIAYFLPSSYIFEGMRQVLLEGTMAGEGLVISFILNIIYATLATFFYAFMFKETLRSGFLAKWI